MPFFCRYYGRSGLVGSAERRMEDQLHAGHAKNAGSVSASGSQHPDIVPVTSGASSPTHALLPHVDTATSMVTTANQDQELSQCHSNSLFGSLATGLERCKLRRWGMGRLLLIFMRSFESHDSCQSHDTSCWSHGLFYV